MASVAARTALAILRNRIRANRAAAREQRAARLARVNAKRRIRKGPRSLYTYVIATGLHPADAKAAASALQTRARAAGIKGRRSRSRRTSDGFKKFSVTLRRYTREQVARIAESYKPRKAEYKAIRAALLAA